ncbi:hypothetical protein IQ260_28035 [Leptolyngbya cf. ectocarpi LEGE 11479]|uniref:Uncharacterized protein n=1 Tax=Leptolyngbya cf. ectocarpi LEGE 11479 TaxID=1828722 RepID=A0A928ZZX8_LEPEC|nr:hypothetical protein [Leptolyngbya ectocarpi]MBE9070498.1 hypothetical protein [Leptolyngbya cf. ectocarpi LEGE 11479]
MSKQLLPSIVSVATLFVGIAPVQAQSWVDPDVLANNPRAYCSDIVAANQQTDRLRTQSNHASQSQFENNHSMRSDDYRHRSRQGGGGFSFAGFGINGQGGSESTDRNQQATNRERSGRNAQQYGSTYEHDHSSVTQVTAGQNCDAFVQGAAHIEATRLQTDVQHHAIDTRERIRTYEIDGQRQDTYLQMLMEGW